MKLIKAETHEEKEAVRKLYLKAFPEEERKPFGLLIKSQSQGTADILYIEDDNGEFAGLGIPAIYNDIVILVFFAIADNKRNGGYGSKALNMIIEKYKDKKFILEIEDTSISAPNKDQRLKRKNFYIKNGLINTGVKVSIMGVKMEVMSNTPGINFDEYKNVYKNAFGSEISDKIKKVE